MKGFFLLERDSFDDTSKRILHTPILRLKEEHLAYADPPNLASALCVVSTMVYARPVLRLF